MSLISDQSRKSKVWKSQLRGMLERALRRKLEYCILNWRRKANELTLVQVVEAKGKTAEALAQVSRKYEALKKMLAAEKMGGEIGEAVEEHARRIIPEVEFEVESAAMTERRAARKKMMVVRNDIIEQYVTLWERKKSGKAFLSKYVDWWRKWILKRQKVETMAAFIIKRLKFGELSRAFDKLRHQKRAYDKTYEDVSRNVLIKQ
jgi:hypothetical protein